MPPIVPCSSVNSRTISVVRSAFDSFELNRERVVQPGQRATIYLSGLSAGRYEFFDDFNQVRRGVLTVE